VPNATVFMGDYAPDCAAIGFEGVQEASNQSSLAEKGIELRSEGPPVVSIFAFLGVSVQRCPTKF